MLLRSRRLRRLRYQRLIRFILRCPCGVSNSCAAWQLIKRLVIITRTICLWYDTWSRTTINTRIASWGFELEFHTLRPGL
jgi:hypothetical protein